MSMGGATDSTMFTHYPTMRGETRRRRRRRTTSRGGGKEGERETYRINENVWKSTHPSVRATHYNSSQTKQAILSVDLKCATSVDGIEIVQYTS